MMSVEGSSLGFLPAFPLSEIAYHRCGIHFFYKFSIVSSPPCSLTACTKSKITSKNPVFL